MESEIAASSLQFQQNYLDFLAGKQLRFEPSGFGVDQTQLSGVLFDYQRDIVRWALKRGKAAVFAMTGLGKTLMQAEWANCVYRHTGGNVLIAAPLGVVNQTIREAEKIGVTIHYAKHSDDMQPGINISNYERIEHFCGNEFDGVVLDESGIIKNFAGATRNLVIDRFSATPYKLACTATPAPNDFMELGNHSEFLGAMTRAEMLAMFFVHDGGETSKWRLKGHAEGAFWEWVSSWAVMLQSPADLGYDDSAFQLPPLHIHDVVAKTGSAPQDSLFWMEAQTLQERQAARRETVVERIRAAVDIIRREPNEKWLLWCDLNSEQDELERLLGDACVSIRGTTPIEDRIPMEQAWREGAVPIFVSKPSVFGWGMNWQHCSRMIFVGLTDSFEMTFQSIRRCYRFGQTREVDAYMVVSDREGAVSANLKRKEADFERMMANMLQHTSKIMSANVHALVKTSTEYEPKVPMAVPEWLVSA